LISQIILEQLQQIERCLKQAQCWQLNSPSAQALASTQPFCIDSLSFTQWLQFVLLPKMYHLIENDLPLPKVVAISPYAEEALKHESFDVGELLVVLKSFDASFSNE